jgi:hypothetical protein
MTPRSSKEIPIPATVFTTATYEGREVSYGEMFAIEDFDQRIELSNPLHGNVGIGDRTTCHTTILRRISSNEYIGSVMITDAKGNMSDAFYVSVRD